MKKVSLFILCCFMPAVANSSSNIDVGKDYENKNARKTEVQPVLNSEINSFIPNTEEHTALVPNIKSRNKDGWGEQKHEPFTAKKFRLFEGSTKRPADNNTKYFYNCPISSDKKYCKPVKGQLNSDVGLILRKEKPTLDADGFITDLQPPVLYKEGSEGFKNYFYRFWNNNAKDCESTGQTSCWSPSYPLVCNSAFNFANFNNFYKDKDGAEKARHYFGWKDKLSGTINNTYTTEDDYKIHVFMAPIKKDGKSSDEDINSGIFTALSPTGWKLDTTKNCLEPEFDYDLVHTDTDNKDNTTTETLVVDDNNSSLSEPKKVKTGGQILPCGSFSDNSKYKGKGFKEIASDYCPNGYYSIGSSYNYNYDRYIVHMPLSTKFINNNSLQDKNNYDLQNSSKEMRTRICGSCINNLNVKDICTEIIRGVLYEKCSKDGNKFKCNAEQLDKVISRLKFDNPGNFTGMISGNKISGYTKVSLKCNICLYRLDTILGGGTDTDGDKFEGLLN